MQCYHVFCFICKTERDQTLQNAYNFLCKSFSLGFSQKSLETNFIPRYKCVIFCLTYFLLGELYICFCLIKYTVVTCLSVHA